MQAYDYCYVRTLERKKHIEKESHQHGDSGCVSVVSVVKLLGVLCIFSLFPKVSVM